MGYRKKLHSFFSRSGYMSPMATMLYFFMAGSGILFFSLLLAHYLYSAGSAAPENFSRLPRIFTVSTLLLVVSGFLFRNLNKAFEADNLKKLENKLWAAGTLGLVFTILQVWGWFLLPAFKQGGSLLVIISAIHLLHLVVGVVWAFYRAWYFRNRSADPARAIIILADPYYRTRINLLKHYWLYTEWVWILAYLYFLWIF